MLTKSIRAFSVEVFQISIMGLLRAVLIAGAMSLTQPGFADSDSEDTLTVTPPHEFDQISPSFSLTTASSPSNSEPTLSVGITPAQEQQLEGQIARDNFKLYSLAMDELKRLKDLLDPEGFSDELYKGIEVKVTGVGEAKVTIVDGIYCVRTLLDGYKLAILNLDLSKLSADADEMVARIHSSDHLRVAIARQIINPQRDVLVSNINEESRAIEGYAYTKRTTRFFSTKWIKNFWNSIKAKPGFGDLKLGIICGIYQGGFTLSLNVLKHGILNGFTPENVTASMGQSYNQAVFTGIFGTLIGVWCTAYRNLISTGDTQTQRVMRSWLVGAIFSYTFLGLDLYNKAASGQSPSLSALLLMLGGGAMHVTFNQFTKDEWNVVSRINKELRALSGNFKLFGRDTGISRLNAQTQATYNFGILPIKLLDLTSFSIAGMPIGRLAYYLSVIPVRLFGLIWTANKIREFENEHRDDPSVQNERLLIKIKHEAKTAVEKWETITSLFYTKPIAAAKWVLSPSRWLPSMQGVIKATPGFTSRAVASVKAFAADACDAVFQNPTSIETIRSGVAKDVAEF